MTMSLVICVSKDVKHFPTINHITHMQMENANMIKCHQQIAEYYIEIFFEIYFLSPSLSGFRSLAPVLALL